MDCCSCWAEGNGIEWSELQPWHRKQTPWNCYYYDHRKQTPWLRNREEQKQGNVRCSDRVQQKPSRDWNYCAPARKKRKKKKKKRKKRRRRRSRLRSRLALQKTLWRRRRRLRSSATGSGGSARDGRAVDDDDDTAVDPARSRLGRLPNRGWTAPLLPPPFDRKQKQRQRKSLTFCYIALHSAADLWLWLWRCCLHLCFVPPLPAVNSTAAAARYG